MLHLRTIANTSADGLIQEGLVALNELLDGITVTVVAQEKQFTDTGIVRWYLDL